MTLLCPEKKKNGTSRSGRTSNNGRHSLPSFRCASSWSILPCAAAVSRWNFDIPLYVRGNIHIYPLKYRGTETFKHRKYLINLRIYLMIKISLILMKQSEPQVCGFRFDDHVQSPGHFLNDVIELPAHGASVLMSSDLIGQKALLREFQLKYIFRIHIYT